MKPLSYFIIIIISCLLKDVLIKLLRISNIFDELCSKIIEKFYFEYLDLGNIVNSIGMVVAYIPEGLPAAVTLVLTIVAKRMYKQKSI